MPCLTLEAAFALCDDKARADDPAFIAPVAMDIGLPIDAPFEARAVGRYIDFAPGELVDHASFGREHGEGCDARILTDRTDAGERTIPLYVTVGTQGYPGSPLRRGHIVEFEEAWTQSSGFCHRDDIELGMAECPIYC